MVNPMIFVPGLSALLFTTFEMPMKVKKIFFSIPIWISSSVIAIFIGTIARGVLGPMTGFMTELILFPGLYLAKKHYNWRKNRPEKKTSKKRRKK